MPGVERGRELLVVGDRHAAVQVLGAPQAPTQLWVRWAGGRTMTYPVPAAAREVEVEVEGTIRVLRQ